MRYDGFLILFGLLGSQEWTSLETPFFLKAGENPDNIKINLVINGERYSRFCCF